MAPSSPPAPSAGPPDVAALSSRVHAAVVELMDEAVLVAGLDRVVQGWYGAAERLTGWPAGEAVGRPLDEVLGPALDVAAFDELVAELRGQRRARRRWRRVGADGSPRWVESDVTLLRDDDGHPLGIVAVAHDVTAEREPDAAIAEPRLHGLASRMNEVELVMRRDGSIVEGNDRALAAYGYTRDELRALNVRALRAPATRALANAQMATAVAEGIRFETDHRRKDGTTFPVEVSSRAFEVDGHAYLHSLVRDLTRERALDAERRALEASVAAALRERDLVLEHSPLALAKLEGRVLVWANRRMAEMLDVALADLTGKSTRAYYPDDEAYERLAREASARLTAGEPFAAEQPMRRADGSQFWCRIQGRNTGRPGETIWSLEDISALREKDALLREREARLARVLEGTSDGYFEWTSKTGRAERSPRVAELLDVDAAALPPTFEGLLARVLPEDAQPLGEAFREVVSGARDALDVEFRVLTSDGSERWLQARARRSVDTEQGTLVSGAVTDVSERREAERRITAQLRRNEALVADLQEALESVKDLRGLLPICMYCHKIRDDRGYWERIERYIAARADVQFSHGLCPECEAKHHAK